ncbi:vacuolar protein sorting-associated protein VTA1 homolog [Culicoides brevitarsis]|uniref:vacuolar protein sorting-associated protein VTA1 homolog n=1 Tax=Culicoides brevitarsis TaxID=469753 RepID=UPI00307C8C38
MAAANCPASLKPISHYLILAAEHDKRDPVVAYWTRLYALQIGLKLSKKENDEQMFLISIMDQLEAFKKENRDNEAITNEVVAQAHLENYALKLFQYADRNDREANFNKNVVKAYFTAGRLYDVLETFGELSTEVTQNRKYAKWKATYIHNCLKNGETPIPGPMAGEGDDEFAELMGGGAAGNPSLPTPATPTDNPGPSIGFQPAPANTDGLVDQFDPLTIRAPSPPKDPEKSPGGFKAYVPDTPTQCEAFEETTAAGLGPELMAKAQKYCKWAGSALNYDDVPTAIENLQKALRLLQTGQDG